MRYRSWNRDLHASDKVIILDIDEQSLKVMAPIYGRWPWPRRVYKDLIEFISIGSPRAVLFDVLFSEQTHASIGPDDQALIDATRSFSFVSHGMQLFEDELLDTKAFTDRFALSDVSTEQSKTFRDFAGPFQALLDASQNVHVVTFDPDSDGVSRRVRLLYQYDHRVLPSLSTQALLLYSQKKTLNSWQDHLSIGDYTIPITHGTVPLHFYKPKNMESISMAAVLASAAKVQKGEQPDTVDPLMFEGKIILIGASATGLEDLKPTPVSPLLPGVVLHATAISNVLMQDFLIEISFAVKIGIAFCLITLWYGILFILQNIFIKVLLALSVICAYCMIAVLVFQKMSLHLECGLMLFLFVAILLDSFIYLSFFEGAEKRKIKGTLSKYISPDVMNAVLATGRNPSAEIGQRQELSILFSDIRGFTTFSESHQPEKVVEMLNYYLGSMVDLVFEHQGTLDKFIGDAVMAFWGAPLPDDQHVRRAVLCALRMQESLVELKKNWKDQENPFTFEIGIGINTGDVIVGNIGGEKRLDYTVIGDNVNLASRLEGLTKYYHAPIILGEKTYEDAKSHFVTRKVDLVRVKGKQNSVTIAEVLGSHLQSLAEASDTAMGLYQKGSFHDALASFEEIQKEHPQDGLTALYRERCQNLLQHPPETWDGTFTATSK